MRAFIYKLFPKPHEGYKTCLDLHKYSNFSTCCYFISIYMYSKFSLCSGNVHIYKNCAIKVQLGICATLSCSASDGVSWFVHKSNQVEPISFEYLLVNSGFHHHSECDQPVPNMISPRSVSRIALNAINMRNMSSILSRYTCVLSVVLRFNII